MGNEYIDLPSGNLPYTTKQEVKFMDLLNEYLLKYYAEHGNKNLYMELEGWSIFNVHEIVVISRRFGFIQRLVENDKIDFDKVYEKEENENIDICMSGKDADMYWLLMLLSIQENPIDFLISIIK